MKIIISKPGIPSSFRLHPSGQGLIEAEWDLKFNKAQRLAAKLVIFKSKEAMHRFWRCVLGKTAEDHGDALGLVNTFGTEWTDTRTGKRVLVVDPRYYCIVGLCLGHLDTEIIAHECGHAALSYVRRTKHRNLFRPLFDFDEEHLCHPLGRLVAAVNDCLLEKGLYDKAPAPMDPTPETFVLKKDLVIRAGTKFTIAPVTTTRSPGHREHVIGFGKDNHGELTVDLEDPKMRRWFEPVAPKKKATKKVAKKKTV